jgi:hypothetical protein
MPAVYSALDIATSSSYGEGFSNAIAEAMACGRPVVATDVGDSSLVIGSLGVLVMPNNATALAEGWSTARHRISAMTYELAPARISGLASVDSLCNHTLAILQNDQPLRG